ncbi:MAG: ATP-dependent zinc metalloprotease FtsH [Planctomycetota bacterium]
MPILFPLSQQDNQKPQGKDSGGSTGFKIPIWYILAGVALLLLIRWAAGGADRQEIGYSEFRRYLKKGQVQTLVIYNDELQGTLSPEAETDGPARFTTTRVKPDDELLALLDEHDVDYKRDSQWLQQVLFFWLLPIALIFILWRFLFSRMSAGGGMGSMMQFGQSKAKMVMQEDVETSFDDVAGIDESKQELEELVEFLQDPERFTRLGGKIPKGALLVGDPGTGKTLLAKALAGEAEVPFFSLSGSDFVEMFAGVGAARVRDLFQQANKNAPCIIFIDELDALAKARGTGMMGGHDEREQTLNALLVQMDGMETTKGIIILAATNRPEMLDPALMRPGRFDRQIAVPRPDLKGREEILKVHSREVRLADSVDLRKIASMTPGFVGADLANLVNEAALRAARQDKQAVEFEDFEQAVERVVAGLEKRNRVMNEEEKKTTAYHECGHAMVACLVPGADRVRKVSMVPRGVGALGYTMQLPQEDRYLLKKRELMDRLTVMLGGRAAEEECFDDISTGAQNDLQKATKLAREMVTKYGMSEEVGPLSYPSDGDSPFWGNGMQNRPWSEKTNQSVDAAIRNLVEDAHKRSRRLIHEHREVLEDMATALRENEVLEEEQLEELLGKHGIELPRPDHLEREDDEEEEPDEEESEDTTAAPSAETGDAAGTDDTPGKRET